MRALLYVLWTVLAKRAILFMCTYFVITCLQRSNALRCPRAPILSVPHWAMRMRSRPGQRDINNRVACYSARVAFSVTFECNLDGGCGPWGDNLDVVLPFGARGAMICVYYICARCYSFCELSLQIVMFYLCILILQECIYLSLIHIWRCRRIERCRSRWSPYH